MRISRKQKKYCQIFTTGSGLLMIVVPIILSIDDSTLASEYAGSIIGGVATLCSAIIFEYLYPFCAKEDNAVNPQDIERGLSTFPPPQKAPIKLNYAATAEAPKQTVTSFQKSSNKSYTFS